jgi:N-glycosylase/DNA lyase
MPGRFRVSMKSGDLLRDAPVALATTLRSGQVFHWNQEEDGSWRGLIGDHAVHLSDHAMSLRIHQGDPATIAHHFALDHPLDRIEASFPDDPMAGQALATCHGMRILRQPRWECLATFITSSMKQVAHIRAMSLALRRMFGSPVEGSPVEAYPGFETVAAAREEDLLACGLGYRAANLLQTARELDGGTLDLDHLAGAPTWRLRQELMRLPGVGVKVANCVLLFAYERLDAVPIDVWIHRILMAMRKGRPGTPSQLARYARRRLGPWAGYVQQYLFHQARTSRAIDKAPRRMLKTNP